MHVAISSLLGIYMLHALGYNEISQRIHLYLLSTDISEVLQIWNFLTQISFYIIICILNCIKHYFLNLIYWIIGQWPIFSRQKVNANMLGQIWQFSDITICK